MLNELSDRQREAVIATMNDIPMKQFASNTGIAISTADAHRAAAMKKLGVNNLHELIKFGIRAGEIKLFERQ